MRLAQELDAAILSIDSMQVYRGMDIGTAKPSPEEMARVTHYQVDVADPTVEYAVATFQADARRQLREHDGQVIVAGGSGLHMRAVLDPLQFPPHDSGVREAIRSQPLDDQVAELVAADPVAGDWVDLANPRRVERAVEVLRLTGMTPSQRATDPHAERVRRYEPEIPFHAFGVDPGDDLEARVRVRIDAMLSAGWLDEVASLSLGPTAEQAVGYRELADVVAGTTTLEEASEQIVRSTLALAKRQRTFFRRDPRITWLDWHPDEATRYAALRAAVDKVRA